jgi:hypothetical protein
MVITLNRGLGSRFGLGAAEHIYHITPINVRQIKCLALRTLHEHYRVRARILHR